MLMTSWIRRKRRVTMKTSMDVRINNGVTEQRKKLYMLSLMVPISTSVPKRVYFEVGVSP